MLELGPPLSEGLVLSFCAQPRALRPIRIRLFRSLLSYRSIPFRRYHWAIATVPVTVRAMSSSAATPSQDRVPYPADLKAPSGHDLARCMPLQMAERLELRSEHVQALASRAITTGELAENNFEKLRGGMMHSFTRDSVGMSC
jgi:hypothetical protein